MFDVRIIRPWLQNSALHHPRPIPKKFHEEKSMVRVGTVVRTLILCGLALTTLAFARTNQNTTQAPTVRQPIRFAISPPMFAVPQSLSSEELVEHEVRSINRN